MRRLVVLIALAVVVVIGGFLALFKRHEVSRLFSGYPAAGSPQEAADRFRKAVQNRDYDYAAEYCTAGYKEQMKRGADASKEFGTNLDDLIYQMKERDLIRDETKVVFHYLDPFPKDITITVSKESADAAEANIVFGTVMLRGDKVASPQAWNLKPEIFQIYVRSMRFTNPTTVVVPMKKERDGWKFDFPADTSLQLRVGYMNDKFKHYVNPFEIVRQEVKNDPSTRENTTSRLKTLLEEAAKE